MRFFEAFGLRILLKLNRVNPSKVEVAPIIDLNVDGTFYGGSFPHWWDSFHKIKNVSGPIPMQVGNVKCSRNYKHQKELKESECFKSYNCKGKCGSEQAQVLLEAKYICKHYH